MPVFSIIAMFCCVVIILLLTFLIALMIAAFLNSPSVPGDTGMKYINALARLVIAWAAIAALMHWW